MTLHFLQTHESAVVWLARRKFWENLWLPGPLSLFPNCHAWDLVTGSVLGGTWGLGPNVGNQEGHRRPSPFWVFRETWGSVGALQRKYF